MSTTSECIIDQESSMGKASTTLSLTNISRYYKIRPYPYQVEIFNRIRFDWENKQAGPTYGNIVYLETGMGKTHISTMLLNYLFDGITYDNDEMLEPNTDEDLKLRLREREALF
jgi:superfamily II DNA or RNA helicase